MPIDSYGNWYPGITPEPATPGDSIIGGGGGASFWLVGSGAPANGLGSNGYGYGDSATGNIYTKSGGVWTQFSGGTVQIISDSFADPNGNVVPDDPTSGAIYYQNSAINNVWRWIVASQTWEQSIG